ncbi:MAG: hypothetical protein Q7S40_30640 [Opitutaceae bacterium]|nr:hypothetical protein [Opitutaceae bacterium]
MKYLGRVDIRSDDSSFEIVARLRRSFAVFMVAFWLLATQHCGLEAAGVWHGDEHVATCCATASGCVNDGCSVVEGGNYNPAVNPLKVSAPDLLSCICLFCASSVPVDALDDAGWIATVFLERPPDWVPTWQFVQRAALSPRAPSLVA